MPRMGGRSSCACHPASPQSRTSTSRAPSPTVGQAMTTPPYAAEHHGGTQPGMSTGKDQGDCMTQCDGGRRSCWGRGAPCRGVTQPPGSAQQLLAATSHRRLRSDPGGSQLLHHSIRMWVDLSHVRTLLTPCCPESQRLSAQSWERGKVISAWFHWETAQEQKKQRLSRQHHLLGRAAKPSSAG